MIFKFTPFIKQKSSLLTAEIKVSACSRLKSEARPHQGNVVIRKKTHIWLVTFHHGSLVKNYKDLGVLRKISCEVLQSEQHLFILMDFVFILEVICFIFSRHFCPKRLTISTFVTREKPQHITVDIVKFKNRNIIQALI